MKNQHFHFAKTIEILMEQCGHIGVEDVSIEKVSGRVLAETLEFRNDQQEDCVLNKGIVIDAMIHSILADHGLKSVPVYHIPMIGIATYQKGISPEELEVVGYQQNDAERFLISDIMRDYGFMSLYLGTFSDNPLQNTVDLKMVTSMCDALIVFDEKNQDCIDMVKLFEAKGMDVLVDQLKLQPVASSCVGILDGILAIGLAGGRAELNTALQLLVVPMIKKIAGYSQKQHEKIMLELLNDFEKTTEPPCIIWGRLNITDGVIGMEIKRSLMEYSITDLRDVDVFAIAPYGSMTLKRGTLLDAYVIKRR